MTHDDLPISYVLASAACSNGAAALLKAGPAVCGLPPSIYVPMVKHHEQSADMLLSLEAYRLDRAARRAEQGRPAS